MRNGRTLQPLPQVWLPEIMFWRCPHCDIGMSFPREGMLYEWSMQSIDLHLELVHGYQQPHYLVQ